MFALSRADAGEDDEPRVGGDHRHLQRRLVAVELPHPGALAPRRGVGAEVGVGRRRAADQLEALGPGGDRVGRAAPRRGPSSPRRAPAPRPSSGRAVPPPPTTYQTASSGWVMVRCAAPSGSRTTAIVRYSAPLWGPTTTSASPPPAVRSTALPGRAPRSRRCRRSSHSTSYSSAAPRRGMTTAVKRAPSWPAVIPCSTSPADHRPAAGPSSRRLAPDRHRERALRDHRDLLLRVACASGTSPPARTGTR